MKLFLDVMYDDTKNARKIKSRDYNNEGKYPIIDQSSKNVISYTDEQSFSTLVPSAPIKNGSSTSLNLLV